MHFGDFLAATLIWLLVLFSVFSAALWYLGFRFRQKQSELLYVPQSPEDSREACDSPVALGIPFSEDIAITVADGVTLKGFIIWPGKPPTPRRGEVMCAVDAAKTASVAFAGPGNQSVSTAHGAAGDAGVSGAREGMNVAAAMEPPGPAGRAAGTGSTPPSFFLIYFHGNAGNAGHRIPLAHAFAGRLNAGIMVVDYRGYGLSSDVEEITQEGIELDAQAVLDYAWNDPRVPRERIFVMGTSLGGAVAIHLAARPENATRIAGVIIENTFTSVSDMTSALGAPAIRRACSAAPNCALWLFNYYFKPLILKLRWRSIAVAGGMPQDLLFLSGQADELIPPAQMKRLYTAAKSGEQSGRVALVGRTPLHRFVEFPEGHHNDLPMCQDYFKTIDSFIKDVTSNASGVFPE